MLRFGQRIGAFLLDRVLRGQHEERIGQLVPHAADGDLPLLHRFEQRGLRLGRRAVDFVGQDHVARTAALRGSGTRGCRSMRFSSMISVPVMSAGIRSGVNWMRLNDRFSDAGQRADHQRLGQAGHAFQQAVAAAEEGDQQLLDHLVLADDDLGQLREDLFAGVAQLANGGRIVSAEAWSVIAGVPGVAVSNACRESRRASCTAATSGV